MWKVLEEMNKMMEESFNAWQLALIALVSLSLAALIEAHFIGYFKCMVCVYVLSPMVNSAVLIWTYVAWVRVRIKSKK